MIQRIQTIYLLLIAILGGVTLMSPLAVFQKMEDKSLLELNCFGFLENGLTVYPTWGILCFALCMTLIPLITVFLYKKRKIQILLSRINILVILLFYLTVGTYSYFALDSLHIEYVNVKYGIILPLIGFILNLLALRAIVSDEKLVRSLDRIR